MAGDVTDDDHRADARGRGRVSADGSTCWCTTPAPSVRCRCDRWPRSSIADLQQVWRTNVGAPLVLTGELLPWLRRTDGVLRLGQLGRRGRSTTRPGGCTAPARPPSTT